MYCYRNKCGYGALVSTVTSKVLTTSSNHDHQVYPKFMMCHAGTTEDRQMKLPDIACVLDISLGSMHSIVCDQPDYQLD